MIKSKSKCIKSQNIEGILGTVLIGGGTGFIGTALRRRLERVGYNVTVISRKPGPNAITWTKLEQEGLPPCKAVVNVAGQNVLDPTKRWTQGFKQIVWSSRVITTQTLARTIAKAKIKPDCFVTMSGVGYYRPSEETEYTEESPGGDHDYLARLCTDWETAARLPSDLVTRSVIIRSGVVLGRGGGMIKQTFLPFFLGLGGPIGSGMQYMPWIHLADIVGIFTHAIREKHVRGVLNGVAPQVIRNKDFTTAYSRALWRPAVIPMPVSIINMIFGSERAKIMTEGQRVVPKRTLDSGYRFKYPTVELACQEFAGVKTPR